MKSDFIRDNPDLIRALRQVQNERTDALIAASEKSDYVASEAFQQKMDRLIQAQRKPYYPLVSTKARKTTLALAAMFILMTTLVFSVSALREPVIRFFVETYEKFSAVFFNSEVETEIPTTLERIYMPAYVPEGYALDEEVAIEMTTQLIRFYNSPSETIEFQQFILGATSATINTEGVQTEEVLVGESVGIFFSNLGEQSLMWTTTQYGFSLSGPVGKDILLAMANSLDEK